MPDLSTILLYRMTHIENFTHILKHGITHISSPNKNKKYIPIGDGSLISARHEFEMPNGNKLGEYIPFYFGPRMPMVYVMQHGFNGVSAVSASNVVYSVTSVKSILDAELEFVFTDGHAVDGFTEFYNEKRAKQISTIVDSKAENAIYWKDENDLDLKRRKEAEFLVMGDIPVAALNSFAVYNQAAATQLKKMTAYNAQTVIVNSNYYF